jgi:hypothetical protein
MCHLAIGKFTDTTPDAYLCAVQYPKEIVCDCTEFKGPQTSEKFGTKAEHLILILLLFFSMYHLFKFMFEGPKIKQFGNVPLDSF